MTASSPESTEKFDPARAAEYQTQSRIALAGYDACHELSACMLAAALGAGKPAELLIVGAGVARRRSSPPVRWSPHGASPPSTRRSR